MDSRLRLWRAVADRQLEEVFCSFLMYETARKTYSASFMLTQHSVVVSGPSILKPEGMYCLPKHYCLRYRLALAGALSFLSMQLRADRGRDRCP